MSDSVVLREGVREGVDCFLLLPLPLHQAGGGCERLLLLGVDGGSSGCGHGCIKFTGTRIFPPPPRCGPTFFPDLTNLIWPLGPQVKVNLNFLLHF